MVSHGFSTCSHLFILAVLGCGHQHALAPSPPFNRETAKEPCTHMWNKKPEEESAPKAAAPRPVIPAQPPVRPAPPPTVTPEEPKTAPRTGVIGPSMTVKGEVHSREELYIDGDVQGSIELQHR